jgi:transcriptional regulator GlxA family with amidase domain
MSAFELGVACEVFGTDRSDRGLPLWDFALCLDRPGPVRSRSGFLIDSPYGLDRVAGADLVIVPSWPRLETPPAAEMIAALHAAYERGAWILGYCSGTFALAYAGLLEGRRATTHWFYADRFRALFPQVELDPDVLYVADTAVMTSAGTSAAVDLSLQVLREVDGPEVANAVARREHLSERTFARRFRAETGTTPHHWLTWQRVLLAQRLLETTELDVDQVARRCGFGGAATLRHHFVARVGTSPQRYRRTFRRAA